MSAPLPIGIVGAGRHATALADREAPLGGAVVAAVAPGADRRDRTAAAALARRIGAAFQLEWQSVAADPALPIVLAAGGAERDAVAEAALRAGKIVVCPAPAAASAGAIDRLAAAEARGGGLLLVSGELRHTPEGARAVDLAGGGALGVVHSIYAAVRLPAADRGRADGAILDRRGWDVLDLVCAAVPHPLVRVHASVAALFGGTADTAVVIARFGDTTIATIELSACLPASIPTVAQGETEIELIGSREALRIEPYRTAVRLYGARDAARLPWLDEPVLSMLREAVRAARGDGPRATALDRWRRVVGAMDAVKTAAARGEAVAAQ